MVGHELQAEPLESQETGSERAGHDGAFFVGPIQFEGVGTEFFEDALGIAGDAECLHGFVGLEEFGGAKDFGGLPGAGHQHNLFGADAPKSFFRREEQFGGGNASGGDVEMLGPKSGDEAGQVVAGTAANKEPRAARRERICKAVQDAGLPELGFGFRPNVRLRVNLGQSMLRRARLGVRA